MGLPEGIEVRVAGALAPGDVRRLYESAGWWKDGDREDLIPALLAGSACVAAAFEHGRLVGMARCLSDGRSDAYIQDVVVLTALRGRGIGGALVAFLRDWCRARGMLWVGLIAEPGTTAFYEALGFRPMTGYTPMLLAPDVPAPGEGEEPHG